MKRSSSDSLNEPVAFDSDVSAASGIKVNKDVAEAESCEAKLS